MAKMRIRRYGESARWSDIVVHGGVAYWVEVANDLSQDARGQVSQVLSQIDATLEQLSATRRDLLQILIYLAELSDVALLNELWDRWVVPGQAPIRACVQAGLGNGCRVEMVITAAVEDGYWDSDF